LVQNSQPYRYRRGARVLSCLAYIFDPFVIDVFGTLSCDATLVTGRKELVVGDIGGAITKLRINAVHCTSSILAVVPLEPYPTLETVVVADGALDNESIEDWFKRAKSMNMYGPTVRRLYPRPRHRRLIDRCHRTSSMRIFNPPPLVSKKNFTLATYNLLVDTSTNLVGLRRCLSRYRTGDVVMFRADGNIV
jgi:non-ribosomal peptide synthetase component F